MNKNLGQWIFRRIAVIVVIFVAFLYMLSMTSSQPSNLGVSNGTLVECPDAPNCVSTQATNPDQRMPAIPISENASVAMDRIKHCVESEFPRASLVRETDRYLHYEFKSLIFRFVDDVEFLIDDSGSVIHFRSASRVGRSDLGANQRRMARITAGLKP